MKDTQQKR